MSDIPETSSARMPASETNSRSTDQPNHRDVWEKLSAEERLAAEESLSLYCKPVELYNCVRRRAATYSLHLQRCLDYRIQAKRKKRILMTVLLSWNDEEYPSLFPLCICLGRLDPDKGARGAHKYHVGRIFTFQGLPGIDGSGNAQIEVNFMLPELDKLTVEVNSGKYFLLIFASAENPISLSRANARPFPVEVASNESLGGEKCLYGQVPLSISPNFLLQKPTIIDTETILHPCIMTYNLQYCFRRKSKIISIQDFRNSKMEFLEGILRQLQISFLVKEFGARKKPSNQTEASREVASMSPSLYCILRQKKGNVSFHYRYYNNRLQRTEVTENFSCPLCLVRCASYKGLKCHLPSSHDHLKFEFSKSEDCPSVTMFVETVLNDTKDVARGIDPRLQTFLYCAKRYRHREPTNDTDQLLFGAKIPAGVTQISEKANVSKAIILHPGLECVPSISDHYNATHALLQVDLEGDSNAIVLPGPDCAPSISDHDYGTSAMLQDDNEGGSNEILHPSLDCVPSISDHGDGTSAMLQDDNEGVSNAIIVHPGRDCVPSISDHDDGTSEVPQVDHEGVSNAIIVHPGPDCVPSISEHDHGTPEVPQARKKDKLPIEQHDPNMVAQLEKRKFYHSHKYQAMELEEVLVDEDSEDEINDGAQEIEDRRRLAILDAPDNVKQFLPMWNSFVKKHRVLADGHMNWACEAFTKYHCADLTQSPSLAWTWRLFMIKLISHGLIKISTFHACSTILEQYRKENQDPKS